MGIFNSSLKNHLDSENNELFEENPQEENPQEKQEEQEKPEENPQEKPEDFKIMDKNDDDLITWQEFEVEFEKKHGRKMNRNDLWAFLAMDKNGDTSISLNEWNEYHNQLGWD